MKRKTKKLQLIFLALGITLFAITYLYYPNINKKNNFNKQVVEKKEKNFSNQKEINSFENLEFKGYYDLDKPFVITSKIATIKEGEPDLVYMSGMNVVLYLKNNRTVYITSAKGLYNKENYNCFFEEDVRATDGETVITANNLDLLAEKNIIEIYNDVNLNYPMGTVLADKMEYDFESKLFKISDGNKVKMKVIQ